MAGLSTLTDTFTDGTINATLWPITFGSSVTETGGRCRLACDTGFSGIASDDIYTFDSFSVQSFPPAQAGATSECYLTHMAQSTSENPTDSEGISIGFYIDRVAGLIYCVNWSGFFDVDAVSETYNATNHAWVQVIRNPASIVWRRSADGATWTTMRTMSSGIPAWVANTDIRYYSDTHRSDGTDNFAEIDNVNQVVALSSTGLAVLAVTASADNSTAHTVADIGVLAVTAASDSTTERTQADTAVLAVTAAADSTTERATADTAVLAVTAVADSAGTHTTADTGVLAVTASADSATARTQADTATIAVFATADSATARTQADTAAIAVSATADSATERATADTAVLAVTASADSSTVRTQLATAILAMTAMSDSMSARVSADTAVLAVLAAADNSTVRMSTDTLIMAITAMTDNSTARTAADTAVLAVTAFSSSGQEEPGEIGDTMSRITYCTREMVQRALQFADTTRLNVMVDRGCRAGARRVEKLTHRRFYPTIATHRFDRPTTNTLWLHDRELAGDPTAIVSGGTTMASGDYILGPETGPPYRWIDRDTSGSVPWLAGATSQRSIAVTGPFGGSGDEDPAGDLASALSAVAGTITVADSSLIGVGDLLRIDDERLVVYGKAYVNTGVTLAGNLTASKGVVSVPVSSGAGIGAGEYIQIGAERMFVESIASNTLTVVRGEQGSVLGTHATSDQVWAPRQFTVSRAQAGTTADEHDSGADIYRNVAPAPVVEANLAVAIDYVEQALGAYSRTLGSADTKRAMSGAGVQAALDAAYDGYGRKTRTRAVGV
jgi:hypothetical protein